MCSARIPSDCGTTCSSAKGGSSPCTPPTHLVRSSTKARSFARPCAASPCAPVTDPRQHSPQRSSVLSPRRATHSDVDRLVAVLSRAFDDDPVACFMFRNEAVRRRALRRFFSLQLRHMFIDHGEVWTTDDLSGAAMWAPPTMPRPRRRDLLRLATLFPALFLLGSDFREATRLVSKIEQARPR